MNKLVFLLIFTGGYFVSGAQKIEILEKGRNVSIRGLSVVNDETFWVSGTDGTIGISKNAGKNIEWLTVPGYEKRDFRDVEAFDAKTAIIMAIDNPAVILKTYDGGKSWKQVYEKEMTGMFLDAMAFDGNHGVCVGDPIDGRLWVIESFDAGNTWQENPLELRPKAAAGEAIFAASGSNIQFIKDDRKYNWSFVTGGKKSSVIKMSNDPKTLPLIEQLAMTQGKESTGAFSWAINGKKIFIVGGDFASPNIDSGNHIFSVDGGKKWMTLPQSLKGFKSCVVWMDANMLIACGTTGVAVSQLKDDNTAMIWKDLTEQPFHVVQKAKKGMAIYLAGPGGVVATLKQ